MSNELVSKLEDTLEQGHGENNILISIPRTASNLLTHLLALPNQPLILAHPRDGYFFLPALAYRLRNSTLQRPYTVWSDAERLDHDKALKSGVSAWETWIADADKQGVGTYVKEHLNWTILPAVESSFLHSSPSDRRSSQPPSVQKNDILDAGNPTAIPDAVWNRVRATFLIRHPALTFPSALRTAIDNEGLNSAMRPETETVMRWECTFHWHVQLFQFLVSQRSQTSQMDVSVASDKEKASDRAQPLIIDASQLQDADFVRRYAKEVRLDPARTQTKWEATSVDAQNRLSKTERRMKDTLLESTGVVKGKLDVVDIDVVKEKAKWEAEFGNLLAERLERLVRNAMPEYEWLFERRWTG